VHGQAPRRGEILEVLGREGHERYRVRWDERHESIVYPAHGVIVTPGPNRRVVAPTAGVAANDSHGSRRHAFAEFRRCVTQPCEPPGSRWLLSSVSSSRGRG